MGSVIWKYAVPLEGFSRVKMPVGARILSVQVQDERPQIWALVPDPNAPTEDRRLKMYGTGHALCPGPGLVFIGTFQLRGGALVFHLFERCAEKGG